MPAFSASSAERLKQCHPDLQKVMGLAITDCPVDFGIETGWRGASEQNRLVAEGKSKTPWPTSKHNHCDGWGDPCSLAVDVRPIIDGVNVWTWIANQQKGGVPRAEIDRRVHETFLAVWKHVKAVADSFGIRLRYGGDWDGDGKTRYQGDLDERFVDLPHIELRDAK